MMLPLGLLSSDTVSGKNIFIYEGLSMQYLHMLVDASLSDENEVAETSLRDLAYSSFLYWLSTRHGDSIKSERLDSFVRGGYIKLLESGKISKVKEIFADPLGWKINGKTYNAYGFESMTIEEYRVFSSEFIWFLRGKEEPKKERAAE